MWIYPSSIGLLKIVKIQGAYYFMFDNDETVWTGHTNPHVVADDVYCHATGCDIWDNSNISGPSDLSEWQKC